MNLSRLLQKICGIGFAVLICSPAVAISINPEHYRLKNRRDAENAEEREREEVTSSVRTKSSIISSQNLNISANRVDLNSVFQELGA